MARMNRRQFIQQAALATALYSPKKKYDPSNVLSLNQNIKPL